MMFGDDMVMYSTGRDEVETSLEEWRRTMEARVLNISRKKTEYLAKKLPRMQSGWNNWDRVSWSVV